MSDILYVMKVASGAQAELARRLMLNENPEYVRLSVIAPLSNYGYPADVEGTILNINKAGLSIGVEDRPEIPRDFVAWKNVAYMADAADLTPATE